jgi:hypothetical protein
MGSPAQKIIFDRINRMNRMKENKHLLAPENPVNPVKNLFIISGRRLAA